MKTIKLFWILLLLVFAKPQTLMAQESLHMELLSHYNDTNLTKLGDSQIWNDVMGWKDTVKNREYMIAGTTDSIYFFDVTNPYEIKLCAKFFGTNTGCVNRDYYPYHHYLYATSDQCTTPGNLQIFNMQYLPDSVVKVYESDSIGALTHTIFIEEKSQRMYMNLNKRKNPQTGQIEVFPMDIVSLVNPEVPVKIGALEYPAPYTGTRVHESYVRNDTAYCSSENAGLFIFDVRDASNPVLLSAITPPYPANAYNHSGWLDSTGKYILFCDETPEGVGMKIYDLTELNNPRIVGNPFKEVGSPHNAYWKGRYAYASMYYGGVQVYDLQDKANPKITAYYDTYPQAYSSGYKGCWGVWPFLPSGIILASDMTNGLFVLRTTERLAVNQYATTVLNMNVYPNPFNQDVNFTVSVNKPQTSNLAVYNLQGKLVAEKEIDLNTGANKINTVLDLPPGLFLLKLTTDEHMYKAQLLKQ
jgi:choice-of-anchor B domain-containing protein